MSRDDVKILFEKAISETKAKKEINYTKGSSKAIVQQIRKDLFKYEEIKTFLGRAWQMVNIKTSQAFLQEMESDITVGVIRDNPDLCVIPMHDGAAVSSKNISDLEKFESLSVAKCKELFGFCISYDRKDNPVQTVESSTERRDNLIKAINKLKNARPTPTYEKPKKKITDPDQPCYPWERDDED